ncbi:MAG: ribosome silencing factor [Treponema sp.]|jgi:ribosome-associated protein|nr:ribosome silencing factor [Treponema sp.]
MDGLSPGIEQVRAICRLLEEHRASDVTALDLRNLHSWTDFFVIATVSSRTHLSGLLRHIRDYAAEQGFAVFRGGGRAGIDDSWTPVDLGTAVVHLMNGTAREFYELEELWNSAAVLYP